MAKVNPSRISRVYSEFIYFPMVAGLMCIDELQRVDHLSLNGIRFSTRILRFPDEHPKLLPL